MCIPSKPPFLNESNPTTRLADILIRGHAPEWLQGRTCGVLHCRSLNRRRCGTAHDECRGKCLFFGNLPTLKHETTIHINMIQKYEIHHLTKVFLSVHLKNTLMM